MCIFVCVFVCIYVCIFVCIYMCVDVCTKHIYVKPSRAIFVYMVFKGLRRGCVFEGAVSYSGNLWHGVYMYCMWLRNVDTCVYMALGGV